MGQVLGFLVIPTEETRRTVASFFSYGNFGPLVIMDVLRRAGFSIEFCSVDTAERYPLVLGSFHALRDAYTFYKATARHPAWQPGRRKFKVMVGGYGMQNPVLLRNLIDYAAFGRAEKWVVSVVDTILGGGVVLHPSVMCLPNIHPVVVAQTDEPYPHEVAGFREEFIGCPLKCRFCHYTFARTRVGGGTSYVQKSFGAHAQEVTWEQVFDQGPEVGWIRSAIDGSSERLRYVFGKRISDADIAAGVTAYGSRAGRSKTSVLTVYNITNFPSETAEDRQCLREAFARARPEAFVSVVVQNTPFHPSLLTPMQWEAVSLYPAEYGRAERAIWDGPRLEVHHSPYVMSPLGHFRSVFIARASPQSLPLMDVLCFSRKLRNMGWQQAMAALEAEFDLSPYLKQYEFGEPFPAEFLSGHIPSDQVVKMAVRMRANLGRTLSEPGWLLGGAKSMVEKLRARREYREAVQTEAEQMGPDSQVGASNAEACI